MRHDLQRAPLQPSDDGLDPRQIVLDDLIAGPTWWVWYHIDALSCAIQVDTVWLHGVVVTHSRFLNQPLARRAADFAAKAHAGQRRLTGRPYVTHVIEAALIVENILGNSTSSFALGDRWLLLDFLPANFAHSCKPPLAGEYYSRIENCHRNNQQTEIEINRYLYIHSAWKRPRKSVSKRCSARICRSLIVFFQLLLL